MRSLALFSIAFATRLAASVTGTVVTTDGSPLPQVKVEAFRPSSYLKTFQEGVREPLASAITDKDGKFSLNVSGAGVIAIRVQPDGYIPALLLAAADEPAGAIGLHRASIVEGKVTANGKGVGGAKVWLIRSEGSSVVVSTNADGLYRVADPRMWAQAIVVLHPDFAPAMHPANALNFSLDAGREVRGTVVDPAGRAVPGAAVNIDHTLFAKSDAAGKFTFPHVAREAMIVSASTEWAAGFTRLAGGEPKVTLHPIARVTGVIRDAEKHPLSGIAVAVASETVPDLAITDANGAFSLTVPPGKYQLFVEESGAGYFALPVSVDATAGDARQDIVARKQGMIEVKVRGEEGKPVAGASLSFFFGVGPDTSAPQPTGRITGIDGSVRVPMLPGEERNGIRLVAIKPGLPPATSAPIGESSRGKSVTITIPNGTSVGGMVLDKDKKPISGVRVDPILEGTVPGELPEAANPSDAWATTDSDGRFSGRLSMTTGGLAFIKKGYMRVQQPIQVREGMPPIEAQLATASSISGRVVNKDGSPASEVTLQAGRRTTITAADGSFLLDEVEPGPQAIRFGRTSPQQQTVTAPARDVVLVLPPTRSVRGRVIDAVTSTPVQKFTVAVEGPANDFAFPIPAESDGGDFKIDVPEGPAKLTVTAPGFIAAKSVAVDPSVTDPIVIRLSRGRTLRGRVIDESQQPIAGVSFQTMDSTSYQDEENASQTGADGSFEVGGINPDAPVRIAFQKEGYVRTEWKAQPRSDGAPVQIVMRRGLKVSGHVVDSSGAGVASVEVTATSSGYGAESTGEQSDDSGAFQFSGLAPARYDFTATSTMRGQRGEVRDIDIAKAHDITITLQSRPTATIYGHVTGDDSYSRSQVSASTSDADMQTARIDLSGNYRMDHAPVGNVEVQATSYGLRGSHMSKRVTIDVAAGAEARVDLAFAPAVAVHGRVTRSGNPLGGVSVSFYGSANATTITAADGAYETSLDAGEYDISIESADGRRVPFSKRVVISDAAEINLHVDPAIVSAIVSDADTGQPIGGAELSASHHGETHTISTATTGIDGASSLEVSRGELLTITASHPGYANASQDLTATDNQAISLRLVHTPGAVVRIVDVRDGRTLTGYVIARDSSGRVLASANESDPDGTVTLPIAPGPYQISASAEGYGSETVKAEVPSGEIRVPLPRGGNLKLHSESDARGTARLIQPNGDEYVRCWCSGIAEIKIEGPSTLVDRISPGSYVLQVSRSDGKTKRIPVSIIEGQTVIVSID